MNNQRPSLLFITLYCVTDYAIILHPSFHLNEWKLIDWPLTTGWGKDWHPSTVHPNHSLWLIPYFLPHPKPMGILMRQVHMTNEHRSQFRGDNLGYPEIFPAQGKFPLNGLQRGEWWLTNAGIWWKTRNSASFFSMARSVESDSLSGSAWQTLGW